MANTLTLNATRANTTLPIEFYNPVTNTWVTGTAQSGAPDAFQVVFTGITAGTYGAGTSLPLTCRLKGSNPAITGTFAQTVTVLGSATTPATQLTAPVLTKGVLTASTFPVSVPVDAHATAYRFQLATDSAFTQNLQTSPPQSASQGAATVSYVFSGLSAATPYYARAMEVGDGTTYTSSNYSAVVPATTAAGTTNGSTDVQPRIDSLSDTTRAAGQALTVNGGGFSPTAVVKVGNRVASVVQRSGDGQIVVAVPAGPGTFPVTVTNGSLTTTATQQLTVLAYDVSPSSVYQNGDYTHNFNAVDLSGPWQTATNPRYSHGGASYLDVNVDGVATLYFNTTSFAQISPVFSVAQAELLQVDDNTPVPFSIPAGPETPSTEVYQSGYLGVGLKRLRIKASPGSNALTLIDDFRFYDEPDPGNTPYSSGYSDGYSA